jgi:hypothetical protein
MGALEILNYKKLEISKILNNDLHLYQGKTREKQSYTFIRKFSEKSGLQMGTVKKIYYANNENINCSIGTIRKMYSVIYSTDSLNEIKRMAHPSVRTYIEMHLKTDGNKDNIHSKDNIEFLLKDEKAFDIFLFCQGKGQNYENIKDEFGKSGIRIIEELLNRDILEIDDYENLSSGPKMPFLSDDKRLFEKAMGSMHSKLFRSHKSDEKNENIRLLRFDFVSLENYKKIIALTEKYHNDCQSIINTDQLEGSIQEKVNFYVACSIDKVELSEKK